MNPASIANVFGALLLVTGGSMLLPIICALCYNDGDVKALSISALIIVAVGLPLKRVFRNHDTLSIRDGLFIACFGWVVISAFSALPFMIHGTIPSFCDAFFEMMSGYTTTGSTILTDIEKVPHGLLFWRSQTHLLGGMGFLTLTIIFLPHGVGGARIFRAESSPGQVITGDRFMARNRDTMVFLWAIYLGLNILQTLLLYLGDMSLFDSLCHAFGTISTSGYSTMNDSVGAFHSSYIDWVTIVFMILGGVTFVLFYEALRGNWRSVIDNTEFRYYLAVLLFFCLSVSWILYVDGIYDSFPDALRYGTFQVVSILTTTGFATANYLTWPQSTQLFLVIVCFIGACAGSTTSGIKIVHYVLIFKHMYVSIKRIFLQPMYVSTTRLNGKPVDASVVDLAVCYFIVNILMVFFGGMVMILLEDITAVTAFSSVVATLMNIGPGFGQVGPVDNFAFFSDTGKWFLAWNMLVGRLEMFSVLVIFYPAFWKR
ncbi:TrkH family potassium uptake protein [Desulfotalea psychrophila]|uniref:Probable Trk system potassium uptake protein (TrkH) n=1 Tax=Desulfotalea psychrophila (strain LSv54 / DSM 12343) TaxID=177439 RepID=Q6AQC1_DESPS|nr:TrkH family potassium uptake protein [Desulfotalea psychrophila]CAG35452.1 probable Trk system potassium uptake protein (TrkH) [Desulfotalea psychrophila LSv54]